MLRTEYRVLRLEDADADLRKLLETQFQMGVGVLKSSHPNAVCGIQNVDVVRQNGICVHLAP